MEIIHFALHDLCNLWEKHNNARLLLKVQTDNVGVFFILRGLKVTNPLTAKLVKEIFSLGTKYNLSLIPFWGRRDTIVGKIADLGTRSESCSLTATAKRLIEKDFDIPFSDFRGIWKCMEIWNLNEFVLMQIMIAYDPCINRQRTRCYHVSMCNPCL